MREPKTDNLCESSPTGQQTTRLAPSPTGALHLGNAFAFVINWALARKHGWHIALRIEDLDTPRVKPGVIEQTIRTLEWLGLDWDSGPTTQADGIERYAQAMEELARSGCVYPCELTRSQIEATASAPHGPEADTDTDDPIGQETRFDPSLRPERLPEAFDDSGANWRFQTNPGMVEFVDGHMGVQGFDLDAGAGDFVVWTKRRTPSYQLAVVVDDHAGGITQVVRGNDLLDSTARQLMLWRALGYGDEPRYTHLPLIRGGDGRRLAKRHGDTRIEAYSQSGTGRAHIIGLLAYWCGITPRRATMSIGEFLDGFSLEALGTKDIVFSAEDDAWLRT